MKKILIALACVLIFKTDLLAQTKFDTCQYIHQFDGEWMYANGNDTIRVYLVAHRDSYTAYNSIEDRIFGWHEFKQGNTVVESNYQNRFMTISNVDTISKNSFSIWLKMPGSCSSTDRIASGAITDYSQARETKIVTVTIDPSGTIMTWKQRDSEGYGSSTGAYGMTLPREFILIRQ